MNLESYHSLEENDLEARLAPEKIALLDEDVSEEATKLDEAGRMETEMASLQELNLKIEGVSLGKDVETGRKNQDAIFAMADQESGFFSAGVFDGVGGQKRGDAGSHLLKETIFDGFSEVIFQQPFSDGKFLRAIQEALEIYRAELDAMGPEFASADSTMSLVFGYPRDGRIRTIAVSVGDSPIYVRDRTGFHKVSIDDGPVEDMRAAAVFSDLTAKIHPRKNEISASAREPGNAIKILNEKSSMPDFPLHVTSLDITEGDEILIASDGFSDQFREDAADNEVKDMVTKEYSPTQIVAASRLRTAQEIEGLSKKDDISVVRLMFGERKKEEKKDTLPSPEQMEDLFLKIKANKHLASFLAESLLGDFKLRSMLKASHVKEFYKKFPTLQDFNDKFDMHSFLNDIDRDNGFEKYLDYQAAGMKFIELMYENAKI